MSSSTYAGQEHFQICETDDLDLLQQVVMDAPLHQEELTISHYSPRKEEEGAQEVMTDLPGEVMIEIIAMTPFPSIFKAVGLSKTWQARFLPSIKSLEGVGRSKSSTSDSCKLKDRESERSSATSFQKQVICQWAKNWETFSPVFIAEDHLVTYGQKSRNWQRISVSFLPEILLQSKIADRSLDMDDLQIDGALLYISHNTSDRHEMYVADILTQRWKQLPPPPVSFDHVCSKVVSNASLGTYKVILFSSDNYYVHPFIDPFLRGNDWFAAHVYDSNSEMWSTEQFGVTLDFFDDSATFKSRSAGAAHINGVLYMMTRENLQHLLFFDLAERTLEEMELTFNASDIDWGTFEWFVDSISLLVCNHNRLMIVITDCDVEEIWVLEVDLYSFQLRLLRSGPPAPFRVRSIDPRPVSDGNCIFFRMHRPGHEEVLAYNVGEDAWSSFPIPAPVGPFDYSTYHLSRSSFQPSLSAFVPL